MVAFGGGDQDIDCYCTFGWIVFAVVNLITGAVSQDVNLM